MTEEEIEKKAYSIANGVCGEDDSEAWHRTKEGAIIMAEWVQEQCHKEYLEANAEIEKQHVQDIKDLQEQTIEQARNAFCRYCQFDCEGHPHDDCTLLQEYVQTIKGER